MFTADRQYRTSFSVGVRSSRGIAMAFVLQRLWRKKTIPPAVAKPTHRLFAKTKVEKTRQVALKTVCDWASEEVKGSRRQVYLVTLPHPRAATSQCGRKLIAPGAMTKAQVLSAVLDACKRPSYTSPKSLNSGDEVRLKQVAVWREYHSPEQDGTMYAHDHIAILAQPQCQFHFLPVKKALLARHGLASHWSCTHQGYWSAVRYCSVASATKPQTALDREPVLWSAIGEHPPLYMCREEPLTAAALRKRSEAKYQAASTRGKMERVTELDVWPIIIEHQFRNGPDDQSAHLKLIAYAKEHCSQAMQAFLFKRRSQLAGLIDSIWQWETVGTTLQEVMEPRAERLARAANEPCVCDGKWPVLIAHSAASNNIPLHLLCRDVVAALTGGRAETTPVVVLAGACGGEGKSLFFKPLQAMFGHEHVFFSPEPGSFPLLDLPGKKVVFLDDWRFNQKVLPFETQCRWFDGSPVYVPRPQNQTGSVGHAVYRGSAPIFVTTKLADIQRMAWLAEADPATGLPRDADASMLYRRLKVYTFFVRMSKPSGQVSCCVRCFAQLLLAQSRM